MKCPTNSEEVPCRTTGGAVIWPTIGTAVDCRNNNVICHNSKVTCRNNKVISGCETPSCVKQYGWKKNPELRLVIVLLFYMNNL